nr:LpqB family beta-propeller domain-containing protein [Gordonia humi]
MRAARAGVAVLLVIAAAVLAGCVSVPDSSAPQPIGTFSRKDPAGAVPVPRRSDDPETLSRNFLKAMADPSSGHRAARKFLTSTASGRWDDQGGTTIVDNVGVVIDERTESAVRLRITADKVGVLSDAGQLLPADGQMVMPVSLTRVRGSWRVSGDLPRGAVTDRGQFLIAYRQVNLYFPDRTMTRLVTDPRWLFGASTDPTDAVSLLLRGPSPDLAGAIGSGADRGASLSGQVTVDGDSVIVNLDNVSDDDTRNRTVLAAQLIWTLDSADVTGTYVLNADDAPLVPGHNGGWRTADVASFEPDSEHGPLPLHLVYKGALVRSTAGHTIPVPGELGATRDVRAAAVTVDSRRAAAVLARGPRPTLVEGPYGGEPTEIASGTTITSPSYGADQSTGYAIIDGRPIQWSYNAQGAPSIVDLDVSAVRAAVPGPITALRVAPDGVRVALVVAGRPMLAALTTNERGVPSLTGVRPAALDIDTAVQDIAWSGSTVMYAVRSGDDSPVMRIALAGGPAVGLVAGNLKPPLTAVGAGEDTVYVADTQGVQQLGTGSGRPDQYWTAVTAEPVPDTIPVVPAG